MRGLIALLTLVFVFAAPASARVFLSLPSGVVEVEATGPGGATYTYDDTGLVCTPSGFSFPLGDTPVSCVDGG
ncbi:MAG: hypothetical protein ACXW0R_12115, partial [Gaiellaceae bacterium]